MLYHCLLDALHTHRRKSAIGLFACLSLSFSSALFAESGRTDYDLDDDGLIEINDLADLNEIRNNLDGTTLYGVSTGCPVAGCIGFEQTTDLDFDTNADGVMDANDTYWNSGEGWEPIGGDGTPFVATFDGGDFTIANLYIDRTSNRVGLFGVIEGAILQNVHVSGDLTSITGAFYVGTLAGQSTTSASTLSNCSVTATVESTQEKAGGLVGLSDQLSIHSCEVNADISVTGSGNRWMAGGLVGYSNGALTISESGYEGNIFARSYIGGLAAWVYGALTVSDTVINANLSCEEGGAGGIASDLSYIDANPSTIERVFVQGSISCTGDIVAGFISDVWRPNGSLTVNDSFSSMSIEGQRSVAGLFADINSNVTVNRVIAAGALTGTSAVGGLVGEDYDSAALTVTDTYWDTESSGTATTDGNGTGLTTTELQCPQSPTDDRCASFYSGWDETVWDFGSSSQYPGLIINGTTYRFTDSDNDGVADDDDVDNDNDGLIEIDDLADLDEIRNNLDGTALYGDSTGCPDTGCNGFELTADLDFDTNGDGVIDANDDHYEETGFANGWQAIPISGSFTGIFDGNNFSIRNLVIESTVTTQGLFRTVDGAVFRNLSIEGDLTSVQSSNRVGLLFGETGTSGVTISNAYFSGTVTATSAMAGGIGGYPYAATLSNVSVEATVSSDSSFAGGFFGSMQDTLSIEDSSFKGSVSSAVNFAGGLAGRADEVQISRTYVIADILTTNQYAGGFFGYVGSSDTDDSFIEQSFTLGSVSGVEYIGGFVSYNAYPLTIRNSLMGSSVSGENRVAGLVGYTNDDLTLENVLAYGAITDTGITVDADFGGLVGYRFLGTLTATEAYWDTETSGQSASFDGAGTGLTTTELQCPTMPGDAACNTTAYASWSTDNWDFGTNANYPTLVINSLIYRDSDNDNLFDFEDDSDSDGVFDNLDAFPNDASETTDSDGDGVGDNADAFPNDASETTDTDGDGVGNNADSDDDGDGISDDDENATGMDPLDADDYFYDTDGDGIYDGQEVLQGTDRNDTNDFVNPLNTSMNGGGYSEIIIDTTTVYDELFPSLLAQGDDGYLYSAIVFDGAETNLVYYRFDNLLNIDTSFGTDGFIYSDDLGVDSYTIDQIRFESDGSRILSLRNCDTNDCMLALDANGEISSTRFQTQTTPGKFDFGTRSSNGRLAITTSDNSQLIYYATLGFDGNTRVMRIDASDEIDSSFNSGNTYLTLDSYSGAGGELALALFEPVAGEFVVFGRESNNLYMAKFDVNGDLDTSFGDNGMINDVLGVDIRPTTVIEDQAGGFLVLAEDTSGTIQSLYIYRLFSDGTLDTSFATNGYFELLEPHQNISYSSDQLFQQGDGHILLPFEINNGVTGERGAGLVKLSADGLIDESYGLNGITMVQLPDLNSPRTTEMTTDHQIVMAGNDNAGTKSYFLVFANTNDQDGDGVVDSQDAFPNDASETTDGDGDGVGDNSDVFPNDGSETTDSDGDGVGDNGDAFPNDASETTDTDGDGVGDNSDAFPNDASETTDTDGDGVGDNSDAFPNDGSETIDTDGDGVGDNSDAFPNDGSETTDTDGDGVGDNSDAFPNDASETTDTDGDGVGDNSDAFPNDASETTDTDGDGVGDNSDAFPNDASETTDTDGDGVGDNADEYPNDFDNDGVNDEDDAFPSDETETIDTDGDGLGNNADIDDDNDGVNDEDDAFPTDATGSSEGDDVDTDNNGLIEVASLSDLDAVRNDLSGSSFAGITAGCPESGCVGYELTTDLNFDTNDDGVINELDAYWNDGEGWAPIGDVADPFYGQFNGNGFVIRNVMINRPAESYVALFGMVENNQIQQLGVDGPLTQITGHTFVAALVAGAYNSELNQLYSVGDIQGTDAVAGLVGKLESSSIENSAAFASVTADTNAAGLVAMVYNSEVNYSLSVSALAGNNSFEGLAAYKAGISSSEIYWDSEISGVTGGGEGSTGGGYTNAELQCPQSPGDTQCATALYGQWNNEIWDFGSDTEYPVLIMNGVSSRDTDGDGVWDVYDAFPGHDAAAVDDDFDGLADAWNSTCDTECQSTSGLTLDDDPSTHFESDDGNDSETATKKSNSGGSLGLTLLLMGLLLTIRKSRHA